MGIKDDVSCEYMSNNEHFADAFNHHIYGGEEVVRPEDLTPANVSETAIINCLEKLITKRARDVFKNLKIKRGDHVTYVLLGIENQSLIHYAMPVRNLLYDALDYTVQVHEVEKVLKKTGTKMDSAEYLSGFSKDGKIYPVITLVINWSNKRWDGPKKTVRYVCRYGSKNNGACK